MGSLHVLYRLRFNTYVTMFLMYEAQGIEKMNADFTPLSALAGGAIIGTAAALLYWSIGQTAGISGVVGGLLNRPTRAERWRWEFVGGLVVGGAALVFFLPSALPETLPAGPWALAAAGLLVGFGTRLGGGCTSGHGVCGTSRMSHRSIAATITFIATGALTVWATRVLGA